MTCWAGDPEDLDGWTDGRLSSERPEVLNPEYADLKVNVSCSSDNTHGITPAAQDQDHRKETLLPDVAL